MLKVSISLSCLCLFAACSNGTSAAKVSPDGSPSPDVVSPKGSGGAVGMGGAGATGGASGTGGVISTGGSTAASGSGGVAGTGGATGRGGTVGSDAAAGGSGGGTVGTGGASGSGGAGSGGKTGVPDGAAGGSDGAASGGETGSTGGASGVGGAGTGGRMGAGGTVGTGGSTTGTGGTTTGTGGSSGTGGVSGTGGASTGSCTAPPDPSPLVGWASESGSSVTTTTGGGNVAATTVTTLTELQAAVKGTTAAVIYVKGVMAAETVTVGSNKTIAGLCGAEIHGHMEMSGSVNVIVRNIKIVGYGMGDCSLDPNYDPGTGCSSGQDAISLQKNAHHVWFDHCDISDGTDGNLDITNAADFVTVSWTRFHYTPRTDNNGSDSTGASGHRFSNLVGGTDSPSTYDDANSLNITWHHNWWADNVVERQPRVRFGKNHIFNNLYNSTSSNYCVRAGIQAQILVEDNVFSGVKNPQQFNNTTDQGTAYITAAGNTYTNTSGTQATGGGGTPFTTPPYVYTPDATASLQAAIQAGAGPH